MDKELKPFPDLAAEVEAAGEILISNHEHEVGALKARIKELEAKLRWIPVEERLPNAPTQYWALHMQPDNTEPIWAGIVTTWSKKEGFFLEDGTQVEITHWKEIELPEK